MNTRALLCAPLRTATGNVGVLVVVNPEHPTTGEDLNLLERQALLRTACRFTGVAALLFGIACVLAAVVAHLAWAVPLRELPTRASLLPGVSMSVAGAFLLRLARRVQRIGAAPYTDDRRVCAKEAVTTRSFTTALVYMAALLFTAVPAAAGPRSLRLRQMVVVGDSMLSGYSSGGLVRVGHPGQVDSVPALIARRAHVRLPLPVVTRPGLPPQFQVVDANRNGRLDPGEVVRSGSGVGLPLARRRPRNLAVPGEDTATVFEAIDGQDVAKHIFSDGVDGRRLLKFFTLPSSGPASQVTLARELQPSFLLVWLGYDEVVARTLGSSATGTLDPEELGRRFRTLLDALADTDAGMAVANLPDPTRIAALRRAEGEVTSCRNPDGKTEPDAAVRQGPRRRGARRHPREGDRLQYRDRGGRTGRATHAGDSGRAGGRLHRPRRGRRSGPRRGDPQDWLAALCGRVASVRMAPMPIRRVGVSSEPDQGHTASSRSLRVPPLPLTLRVIIQLAGPSNFLYWEGTYDVSDINNRRLIGAGSV